MTITRKDGIRALLKGIETGDAASVAVVNPEKYVQHNPETSEGGEGLAALFKRLSKTSPRVNIVRIFSDGDFVFGHTEYDFSSHRVGFEVFRFEGDQTVEHWDNIQARKGPNQSGHSMVDGSVEVRDLDKTEDNRAFVETFIKSVLILGQVADLSAFVSDRFIEHNPTLADGRESLIKALTARGDDGASIIRYEKLHRVLAEGNFVLSVCEGFRSNAHTSFYDLFRIEDGLVVEHWDTTEAVPPLNMWKNDNGKF
jgi:predicted SnoaL-like aldol condensation-catalyzing enzyme